VSDTGPAHTALDALPMPRSESMNSLREVSLSGVAHAINDAFARDTNSMDDVDRNEDLLSYKLIGAIRSVLDDPSELQRQPGPQSGFYMAIQAYKATGRLEQQHGDIAIVVTDLDCHLSGTGFYEAKAEAHNGLYPSYRMRQLRRLESSTPRLAVAMYERQAKPVNDDEYDAALGYRTSGESYQLRYCRVLPASWVRQFSRLEAAANQMMPTSFGHHFVTRYLPGRDLDFSRNSLDAIDRWVRITRRAQPVVLEIVISRNPDYQYTSDPLGIIPGSDLAELDTIEKRPLVLEPSTNASI
jgi:hypothetical protein